MSMDSIVSEPIFHEILNMDSLMRKASALSINLSDIQAGIKRLHHNVEVVNTSTEVEDIHRRYVVAQEIAGDEWIWSNPGGDLYSGKGIFYFLHQEHAARFKLSV